MFRLQDTPRTYVLAAWVSFLFFALQSTLLLALDVTTSYFQAQLIIAIGLFGLLLGTTIASYVQFDQCERTVGWSALFLWALPVVSIGLVLVSFSYPLAASIGFVLVFVPLGFVLSALYRFASAWRLYASELLGAVVGLGYFIVAIPLIRSENAFILLICLAALGALLVHGRLMSRSVQLLLIAVVLASSTGLLSNILNHHINFSLHTLCNEPQIDGYTENKIVCLDELGVPYEVQLSLGSLQNRIDVYRTATDGFFFTAYSGIRNDVIQPFPSESYTQDARVPAGLIADPKTLIIGAGAEGVAKVVKSLGATDITVVESNPAVLDIWNDNLPYAAYAHYPLNDTRVVLDDGRLLADRAQAEYDIITMMNTRRSLHAAQFGFPNFLHTKEAFASYYDALTADGFLAIEEVSYKNEGDLAIARVVATAIAMLQEQGAADPYQHILMYQWVGAEKDQPIPIDPELVYSQLLVKKSPWSVNDLAAFRDWADWSQQTGQFMKPANMTYYRHIWLSDTGINPAIVQPTPLTVPFTDQLADVRVLTDSSPFMTNMSLLDKTMVRWFVVGSVMLLLALFIWLRRDVTIMQGVWLAYFFCIGVGYMAIEMFLLSWLQLYLGSIFITLVIVIGGLFAASALASWYYEQKQFSIKQLTSRVILVSILMGIVLYLPWGYDSFMARVLYSLGIVSITGVLLAPFFPFAMQLAHKQFPKQTPLWFGSNAIALAITVPLALVLVSYASFAVLLGVGIAVYVIALVLLQRIHI